MKRLSPILTVLVLGRLGAAEARPELALHQVSPHHVAPLQVALPLDRFELIGPRYKAAQELPSTFFNPFKSQTNSAALARKETPSVTNEVVAEALGKRGVSGIVLSPDLRANRVVVGNEVFGVDDELSFPDPKQSEAAPLVTGATVVLRAIRHENLEFEIRVEGEATRTMAFPLRRFWAR